MSNEQALLNCTFGWGKTCHLYLDSIEVAGESYNLDDLTAVYPTYRNVLGVPSARLELLFGPRRLVLRGIPDVETARLIVAHLKPYCSTELTAAHSRSRSARARSVVREQARTWERSTKLPAIPVSPEVSARSRHASGARRRVSCSQESSEDCALADSLEKVTLAEPVTDDESFRVETPANESSEQQPDTLCAAQTEIDIWPTSRSQPLHTPRFQPPLRSVHLIAPGQKIQDTCSVPVPAARSSVLPIIHVPVRLQPGECAHYSIGASLCSDRISGSDRAPYPPLDHGLLILTNRRIFYIGKRSQLILAYTHLWYVSLLHNAIALHIEQQFRRIIIELEHPHEWASRIEQLSFIARRKQPRPELPTLLMAALPGLQASPLDAATLKRPAIKTPAPKTRKEAGVNKTPLLPERIASRIVDAPTISLAEEPGQDCAERKTQDMPISPMREENTVTQPEAPGEIVSGDLRQEALANMPTQDFPRAADLAEVATRELSQAEAIEERSTQELSPTFSSEMSGIEMTANEQEKEEITTSTLCDPAASLAWNDGNCEEIDTLPLHGTTESPEEIDEQTIPLRDQHTIHIRKHTPVSDRLPDIDITPRCLTRTRRTRPPSYAKETKPH